VWNSNQGWTDTVDQTQTEMPLLLTLDIAIEDKTYLVETKAERDLKDVNVKQKRLAALDWIP
jgi:hypothetical protein